MWATRHRFKIALLYILALLVVGGRLGNALSHPDHFWSSIINIHVPISSEALGADAWSLLEYFVVYSAGSHLYGILKKLIGR